MGRGSSKVGSLSLSRRIAGAKSLTQAVRIAERNGIHLDSSVMRDVGDEQLIKDGLEEVAWMKEQFPILGDVNITSDSGYSGAYMYSRSDKGEIVYAGFSPDKTAVLNGEYRLSAGLKDRNGLTDSPYGTQLKHVVTHEMGHQVVRTACNRVVDKMTGGRLKNSTKKLQDSFSDAVVKAAYDEMPKSERGRKGLAGLKKQISKYAHSGGSNETIAEAMADYRANGSKAKPLSRSIYKNLKKYTSAEMLDYFAK